MSDESDVEMNAQEEEQELADNEDRTEEELTLDDLYTRYRVRRTCLEVRVNTHTHTHTHTASPPPLASNARQRERKDERELTVRLFFAVSHSLKRNVDSFSSMCTPVMV